MIDRYIILKRKPPMVIKLFIILILSFTILVIHCINTFYYISFFQIHSKILNKNNFYLSEILIPIEEVYFITKQDKLKIGNKEYNYQVYEIDPNAIYQENKNCRKVYLMIKDLDEIYQVNGCHVDLKIAKEKKKIIDYLE